MLDHDVIKPEPPEPSNAGFSRREGAPRHLVVCRAEIREKCGSRPLRDRGICQEKLDGVPRDLDPASWDGSELQWSRRLGEGPDKLRPVSFGSQLASVQ